MSASRIRLRAAERFSETFDKLEIVDWKRFCTAPRPPRIASIWLSAPSITLIAFSALSWVETEMCSTVCRVEAVLVLAPLTVPY
jgi:hypothetical protein